MRDEFNTQRAKLKELFLQKESDVKRLATSNEELRSQLDECRSQMGLLQLEKERELEEVASLKAFVQETINESRDEDDTRRLLREIERLRRENAKLNEVVLKQESNTLAPVLNQVKKFALKIGTDQSHASSDSASSSSHSSLDDAAAGGGQKKGNKYVSRKHNNNKRPTPIAVKYQFITHCDRLFPGARRRRSSSLAGRAARGGDQGAQGEAPQHGR